MTKKEILTDFFKKTIAPVVSFLLLALIFKSIFQGDENANYYIWMCCGIPYGIRHMFIWLVPHGYDIGSSLGIIAMNFIIGGLIGGVILAWKLLVAAWYIPLSIYRLISA